VRNLTILKVLLGPILLLQVRHETNCASFRISSSRSISKNGFELYSFDWLQEPREDVDVFFKHTAPKDSVRRVRSDPGTARGRFASTAYLKAAGSPVSPSELAATPC